MAVRKVSYVDLKVPNRGGQAARILGALEEAGIDLLAFTGFPAGAGRSQIDLVTDDIGAVRRVARKQGWRLGRTKRGFLVQGRNRVGAVRRGIQGLAEAGVNITALDAVAASRGE